MSDAAFGSAKTMMAVFIGVSAGLCARSEAAPKGPTPVPVLSDFETVRRAAVFSTGPVGFAGTRTAQEKAFRKLLEVPNAAAECRKLIADGTRAGQLYGLLGLKLLDDPGYGEVLQRYRRLGQQVQCFQGCVMAQWTMAKIAKDIDEGALR